MDDCDFSTLNRAPFAPAITTTQADEDDNIYYSCNEEFDFEDDEYDEDEPEDSYRACRLRSLQHGYCFPGWSRNRR
ncbi:hypothetical protein G6F56_013834 [Rhizopus delemar]|nr:hypothetical protein G6F56_013834 [Rhizopus delemar]